MNALFVLLERKWGLFGGGSKPSKTSLPPSIGKRKPGNPLSVQCREIWLPFSPVSKERPRFGKGRTYMNKEYQQWKGDVRSYLSEWWTDKPLDRVQVVVVHFYGPARGDLDNRVGSLLDAAKGVLFTDDSVSVIPALVLRHNKAPTKQARIYMMIVWEEEQ